MFVIKFLFIIFLDRKTTNSIIGDIVKVFSPFYQSFFRARIENIVDNTKFHVSYVDFGNTEIVNPSDIFELSDALKNEVIKKVNVMIDIYFGSNYFFHRLNYHFGYQLKFLQMPKSLMR